VLAGGRHVLPRGLRAAARGALDVSFLMSVAAVGGLLIGEHATTGHATLWTAVAADMGTSLLVILERRAGAARLSARWHRACSESPT
jgi:cation transport ATPase